MTFMNKKVALVMKIPQLQNLIKRDPTAYKEEFLMQKRHFDNEMEISCTLDCAVIAHRRIPHLSRCDYAIICSDCVAIV
jgi:hypothetical protein